MPNYEFNCPKCEHSEDIQLRVKDRNKRKKCPECGKLMKRNMIGTGAFKLSWVEI